MLKGLDLKAKNITALIFGIGAVGSDPRMRSGIQVFKMCWLKLLFLHVESRDGHLKKFLIMINHYFFYIKKCLWQKTLKERVI